MTPISTESAPRSRRTLLAGVLGGVAAWAASAATRVSPAEAAVGDPIRIGRTNRASGSSTSLQTTASAPTFRAIQNGAGHALRAEATSGRAVMATAGSDGTAVWAFSPNHYAVAADSPNGVAIVAESSTNIGMEASGGSVGVVATGVGDGIGLLAGASVAAAEFQGGPVRLFCVQDIYHQLTPPGPAPGTAARLFARDNSSGKLELCVRFPTGPVQVIATEP